MGSGLVEVENICFEEAVEVLLMEDQEVIQAFSPHASQKAFTNGIRAARVRYGVRSTLMPLVISTRATSVPNLRKNCRTSSKDQQKREADGKIPKTRI